jgi:hypothetical protein
MIWMVVFIRLPPLPVAAATAARADSPTPVTLPWQETDPFAFDILGVALLHLAGQTLVFGAAVVLLDAGLLRKLRRRIKCGGKQDAQAAKKGQEMSHGAGAAGNSCGTEQGEERVACPGTAANTGAIDAVVSLCCPASTSR